MILLRASSLRRRPIARAVVLLVGLAVAGATSLSARSALTDARRPGPAVGVADASSSTPGEARGRRSPADLSFKEVALIQPTPSLPGFVTEPGWNARSGGRRPGHLRRLDRPPIG